MFVPKYAVGEDLEYAPVLGGWNCLNFLKVTPTRDISEIFLDKKSNYNGIRTWQNPYQLMVLFGAGNLCGQINSNPYWCRMDKNYTVKIPKDPLNSMNSSSKITVHFWQAGQNTRKPRRSHLQKLIIVCICPIFPSFWRSKLFFFRCTSYMFSTPKLYFSCKQIVPTFLC